MTSAEISDVRKARIVLARILTRYFQALDLPSIKSHHWKIWPCSAVTGENLVEGLDWIVDDVAQRIYYSSTTEPMSTRAQSFPTTTQTET